MDMVWFPSSVVCIIIWQQPTSPAQPLVGKKIPTSPVATDCSLIYRRCAGDTVQFTVHDTSMSYTASSLETATTT